MYGREFILFYLIYSFNLHKDLNHVGTLMSLLTLCPLTRQMWQWYIATIGQKFAPPPSTLFLENYKYAFTYN